jgi:undecaprenyl diphosphate synthase
MSPLIPTHRLSERARHVAIITDGNGRWAHLRGLPACAGHEAGADVLKARISDAIEFGIEELTVYSFSTENWTRPTGEISSLLSMLSARIANETPDLSQQGVRMRFIGRRLGLPESLTEGMRNAERLTAGNHALMLFVAINYGGRAEILDAAKRFRGSTEEEFRRCLYAPEMHDPELIIRTGSEQRLSNFLLWQATHSELIIREELWPDFTRQSLKDTLIAFAKRQRQTESGPSPQRPGEPSTVTAISNAMPGMISPNDSTLPAPRGQGRFVRRASLAPTDHQ